MIVRDGALGLQEEEKLGKRRRGSLGVVAQR
jgi:hypothetical protein